MYVKLVSTSILIIIRRNFTAIVAVYNKRLAPIIVLPVYLKSATDHISNNNII